MKYGSTKQFEFTCLKLIMVFQRFVRACTTFFILKYIIL